MDEDIIDRVSENMIQALVELNNDLLRDIEIIKDFEVADWRDVLRIGLERYQKNDSDFLTRS